jgi:amylosucrase
VPFSVNAATGDERTCGMTATLAGLAAGLDAGDADQVGAGVARVLLLYAVAFGWGGIPAIYMGDEVGLGDDEGYGADPARAADSRWRHRPALDEALVARRSDPTTPAGAIWAGMVRLGAARRACRALHGAGSVEPVDSGHPSVFAWWRRHPRFGAMLGLANVSATPASASPDLWTLLDADPGSGTGAGSVGGAVVDLLDLDAPTSPDLLALRGYGVRWLTADAEYRTSPAVPPA